MRPITITGVAEMLEDLVAEHGTQKKAAAALGVPAPEFSIALNKKAVAKCILDALGLERHVVYLKKDQS